MINNTFPIFKKFGPDDFKGYQDFLFSFSQQADFTINNLLVWFEGDKNIEYCWINKNILLKINASIFLGKSKKPYYILIGNTSADKTLDKIFSSNSIDKLIMVPDYFVKQIKSNKFKVSEDVKNRDYILDVDALIERRGKNYENFRHKINYFNKNYGSSIKIKQLDLTNPIDIKLVVNSIHGWKINSFSANGNDPYKHDGQAINKLLTIQDILLVKHRCLGVFVNEKLEGISIYQIPHAKQKIAIGNHIKHNGEIKGIFDFLVYATAIELSKQGIKWLNSEQDMGISGIKRYKANLNPVEYYKKYSVSL